MTELTELAGFHLVPDAELPIGFPDDAQAWECDAAGCPDVFYVIPGNTHDELPYHRATAHPPARSGGSG